MTSLALHWRAALLLVLVLLLTSAAYDWSLGLADLSLRYRASYWLGIVLFTGIVFAPALLYPYLWLRGVPLAGRALASVVPLTAWLAKELLRVTEVYTNGEALYLLLNPLYLNLLLFVPIQMALADVGVRFCRRWLWRKKEVSVFTRGNLLGLLATFGVFIAFQSVGLAYARFYLGVGYNLLFR